MGRNILMTIVRPLLKFAAVAIAALVFLPRLLGKAGDGLRDLFGGDAAPEGPKDYIKAQRESFRDYNENRKTLNAMERREIRALRRETKQQWWRGVVPGAVLGGTLARENRTRWREGKAEIRERYRGYKDSNDASYRQVSDYYSRSLQGREAVRPAGSSVPEGLSSSGLRETKAGALREERGAVQRQGAGADQKHGVEAVSDGRGVTVRAEGDAEAVALRREVQEGRRSVAGMTPEERAVLGRDNEARHRADAINKALQRPVEVHRNVNGEICVYSDSPRRDHAAAMRTFSGSTVLACDKADVYQHKQMGRLSKGSVGELAFVYDGRVVDARTMMGEMGRGDQVARYDAMVSQVREAGARVAGRGGAEGLREGVVPSVGFRIGASAGGAVSLHDGDSLLGTMRLDPRSPEGVTVDLTAEGKAFRVGDRSLSDMLPSPGRSLSDETVAQDMAGLLAFQQEPANVSGMQQNIDAKVAIEEGQREDREMAEQMGASFGQGGGQGLG